MGIVAVLLFAVLAVCFPGRPTALFDQDKSAGFVPLFNGKDLAGWKVLQAKTNSWTAEDGLLITTGKGGGWFGTEREYANFVLHLEYKLKPGGNSGVYLRSPDTGHISRVGMEIQLLDDDHPSYAKLNSYQYTAALYHVKGPSERAGKPAGQWNEMEIRADGRKLTVVLNGKKVLEADLEELSKDPATAKEHPGLARTTGRIGLQNHTDRVDFRNLRIKELKP